MLMLKLNLLSIISKYPRVNGELVGIDGRSDMAEAHRPIVMKVFTYEAPGISSRIRGKIIGSIGHKGHVQKLPAQIAGVRILVEEIENAEIANPYHEASTVHGCAKLHRVGVELY